MPTSIKNVSNDLTLRALNGIITLDSPSTVLTGDLTVLGTTTTIDSTNTSIQDNVIVINANAVAPPVYSGFNVDRGPAAFVPGIRWNEGAAQWEYTNNGVAWSPFGVAIGGGGGLMSVSGDPSPSLGGHLDIAGQYIFDSTTDYVNFQDTLGIKYSAAPASLANYAKLYANTPSGGGTGVFVVNSTTNQELVSKSKALAFSIIF